MECTQVSQPKKRQKMGQTFSESFVWNTPPPPSSDAAVATEAEVQEAGDDGELVGDGTLFPIELLTDTARMPTRATAGAAGYDLHASQSLVLGPGDRTLVKTGVAVVMEDGMRGLLPSDTVVEAMVRGRSSLAKKGIDVFNGTIDSDYRGEIKVLMTNIGATPFKIEVGDRIAQLVFAVALLPRFVNQTDVQAAFATTRGKGGFGSTGGSAASAPTDAAAPAAQEVV